MGNEQSSSGMLSSSNSDSGVIQVVSNDASNNVVADPVVAQLRNLPKAQPIIPEALQTKAFEMNAHFRDADVSRIDQAAVQQLCAIMQTTLREEALVAALSQKHLYAMVHEVDARTQKANRELINKEREYMRYSAYSRDVHSLGRLLAQTRMHAYKLADALHELNKLLPPEEQLVPFAWNVVPEHVKRERLERERISSERRLKIAQEKQQILQQSMAAAKQQQQSANTSTNKSPSTISSLWSKLTLSNKPTAVSPNAQQNRPLRPVETDTQTSADPKPLIDLPPGTVEKDTAEAATVKRTLQQEEDFLIQQQKQRTSQEQNSLTASIAEAMNASTPEPNDEESQANTLVP